MEKVYIVLEQFLDDDECQNVYTFSTKENAIAYSQNRIDYFLDIDTSHCDFSLDYCQWFLFIPWNVCIRVLENQVDIMKTDRKPCLKANCLAKENFYILTN